MKNILEELPACPVCGSLPGFAIGATSSGGVSVYNTGISCPNHFQFFVSTVQEYPTDYSLTDEDFTEMAKQYRRIVSLLEKRSSVLIQNKWEQLNHLQE